MDINTLIYEDVSPSLFLCYEHLLGIYFYSGMGHTQDGSLEVFTTPPKTVAKDGSFGQNDRSLPSKHVDGLVRRVLHHCSTFADNRVDDTHCVKTNAVFSFLF